MVVYLLVCCFTVEGNSLVKIGFTENKKGNGNQDKAVKRLKNYNAGIQFPVYVAGTIEGDKEREKNLLEKYGKRCQKKILFNLDEKHENLYFGIEWLLLDLKYFTKICFEFNCEPPKIFSDFSKKRFERNKELKRENLNLIENKNSLENSCRELQSKINSLMKKRTNILDYKDLRKKRKELKIEVNSLSEKEQKLITVQKDLIQKINLLSEKEKDLYEYIKILRKIILILEKIKKENLNSKDNISSYILFLKKVSSNLENKSIREKALKNLLSEKEKLISEISVLKTNYWRNKFFLFLIIFQSIFFFLLLFLSSTLIFFI